MGDDLRKFKNVANLVLEDNTTGAGSSVGVNTENPSNDLAPMLDQIIVLLREYDSNTREGITRLLNVEEKVKALSNVLAELRKERQSKFQNKIKSEYFQCHLGWMASFGLGCKMPRWQTIFHLAIIGVLMTCALSAFIVGVQKESPHIFLNAADGILHLGMYLYYVWLSSTNQIGELVQQINENYRKAGICPSGNKILSGVLVFCSLMIPIATVTFLWLRGSFSFPGNPFGTFLLTCLVILGIFYSLLIKDILISALLAMSTLSKCYLSYLETLEINRESIQSAWKVYQTLRVASFKIRYTLGDLFWAIQVENNLFNCVLLVDCAQGNTYSAPLLFIRLLLNLKTYVFYFLSHKCDRMGKNLQNKLKEIETEVKNRNDEVSAEDSELLNDIKRLSLKVSEYPFHVNPNW